MNVFVLNTKEDILKNEGNRAVFFSYYGSQWCPKTAWLQTFFKISSFVFSRTKKFIQVWNYLRMSKWWQNFHFWVNYPFKPSYCSLNVIPPRLLTQIWDVVGSMILSIINQSRAEDLCPDPMGPDGFGLNLYHLTRARACVVNERSCDAFQLARERCENGCWGGETEACLWRLRFGCTSN